MFRKKPTPDITHYPIPLNAKITTLRYALGIAASPARDVPHWLFVDGDSTPFTLDTRCFFAAGEDDDAWSGAYTDGNRTFYETLDITSIEDCIVVADRLAGKPDDGARLQVFNYYYRFDAFPDRLNAPDPAPAAELQAKHDREWYDQLGPENPAQLCRREGCSRGSVKFSVLCRPHHFEMVLKKQSPFRH